METIKLSIEVIEKEIFSTLETESWSDTLFCLIAYLYVALFIFMTCFVPLSFFAILFLAPNG